MVKKDVKAFINECYNGPLLSRVEKIDFRQIDLSDNQEELRDKVQLKFFLRHTTLKVDDDVFYGQTDLNVSTILKKSF